jgi:hypothetical protein
MELFCAKSPTLKRFYLVPFTPVYAEGTRLGQSWDQERPSFGTAFFMASSSRPSLGNPAPWLRNEPHRPARRGTPFLVARPREMFASRVNTIVWIQSSPRATRVNSPRRSARPGLEPFELVRAAGIEAAGISGFGLP